MKKRNGFTLVELSIVLVIIGLVIAGIMGGEELIKGARAGRTVSDATKYFAAFNTFKMKYGDVPGDMPDAWDTFTSIPAALQVNSCTTPTCAFVSQAGDGLVMAGPESALVFVELSMAGILPSGANTTPSSAMPEAANARCKVNMPKAPYQGSCWQLMQLLPSGLHIAGTNGTFLSTRTNWLTVGAETAEEDFDQEAQYLGEGAMTVEDAIAIDLKADDGQPGTGDIIAGNRGIFAIFTEEPLCVTFSGGGLRLNYPDTTSSFNITEKRLACMVSFKYK